MIELPFIMQKADPGDPDIEYSARLLRRYLVAPDYDEGVNSVIDWKVTERAAGATFTIEILAGGGVVQGDDETRQGNYVDETTATEQVTLSGAPTSGNARYDLVVARIRDEQAGGPAHSDMIFDKVTGTPATAGTQTVPALPGSCLLLAVIGPILSSTTSITTALIHDAQSGTGPTEARDAHRVKGQRCAAGTVWSFDGIEGAVPNGWLLRAGQEVSRTTYAALWNAMGRPNTGNGSTTFNVVNARGRVDVALDNMGGSDAGNLSAANTLGATGGLATHTLTTAEIPTHTHPIDHDHGQARVQNTDGTSNFGYGSSIGPTKHTQPTPASMSNALVDDAVVDLPNYVGNSGNNAGGGGAHNNLQPYVLVNSIVRT